jgi:hypothetical protein
VRSAKKFPRACKSQGDTEHPEKTLGLSLIRVDALQNPVQFDPETLAATISAHIQGDIE